MEANRSRRSPLLDTYGTLFAVTVTGFGIGWLMGLSVSPVVSIVIASVTGSAAAVIAALSGLEGRESWRVNPWPVGLMLLGLVLGSAAGMRVRNDNLFGQNLKAEIARWKDAGLTLNDAEVARRLFDVNYPSSFVTASAPVSTDGSVSPPVAANPQTRLSALFGNDSGSACDTMVGYEGDLAKYLRNSPYTWLRPLPDIVDDPATLKQILERVLCAE